MNQAGRSVPPQTPHRIIDVETPHGPARCYVVDPSDQSPCGTLVLGHGAGKGTNTPDLHGVLELAVDGWRVVLVDQPWVLAGRKLATRPPTLDDAWRAVLAWLRAHGEVQGTLVVGGRSAGARVACRTAMDVAADVVLALAFPLMPPGAKDKPEKWRTAEAQGIVDAGIPLVVVQGHSDTFATPDDVARAVPGARVLAVAGGHGFATHPDDVVSAVRQTLAGFTLSASQPPPGSTGE